MGKIVIVVVTIGSAVRLFDRQLEAWSGKVVGWLVTEDWDQDALLCRCLLQLRSLLRSS